MSGSAASKSQQAFKAAATEALEAKANAFAYNSADLANAEVREGRYDFRQLKDWRDRLRPNVLGLAGVVLLDIDDIQNRITVGVVDESVRDRIKEVVARLEVEEEAVVVEEVGEIRLHQKTTDRVSPAVGGIEIERDRRGACTLGLSVQLSSSATGLARERLFLTASHCTNVQGGVENTAFYQPAEPYAGNPRPPNKLIGYEVGSFQYRRRGKLGDPFYRDRNYSGTYSGCPAGRECRFSDAALVQYNSGEAYRTGEIFQATSWGQFNGSITRSTSNPTFFVVEKATQKPIPSSISFGNVNKMGKRTGWTIGPVGQACVDLMPGWYR